jgi:hypothetical protein
VSGLPALVYDLVRYSGEARVAAVAAIVDNYLQDADYEAILADAGLAAADIADDEVPAGDVIVVRSPLEEEYRRLCGRRDLPPRSRARPFLGWEGSALATANRSG